MAGTFEAGFPACERVHGNGRAIVDRCVYHARCSSCLSSMRMTRDLARAMHRPGAFARSPRRDPALVGGLCATISKKHDTHTRTPQCVRAHSAAFVRACIARWRQNGYW
jgi:hypothetical protein